MDGFEGRYRFGYLTFGELSCLTADNPVLRVISESSVHRLATCPDISEDFPSFFFILNDDHQIVCSVKALPDFLWLKDRRFHWAWTGGIFTVESCRGKGLARMLVSQSNKVLQKHNIGRGTVYSKETILHIYERLGYLLPGFAARYLMVKNPRPLLENFIKARPVARILGGISSPIIKLILQNWHQKDGSDPLDTEIIELPSDATINGFREQFPEVHHSTPFHFNDSLPKLVWKAVNTEGSSNCVIYLLAESGHGNPIAYFILRTKEQIEPMGGGFKDFRLMTLMDYGLFQNNPIIYRILLKAALKIFWRSEAEVFEIITNSELFGRAVRHMGLLTVGKGMSYGCSIPSGWGLERNLGKLNDWPLTHFCGDAFSF